VLFLECIRSGQRCNASGALGGAESARVLHEYMGRKRARQASTFAATLKCLGLGVIKFERAEKSITSTIRSAIWREFGGAEAACGASGEPTRTPEVNHRLFGIERT